MSEANHPSDELRKAIEAEIEVCKRPLRGFASNHSDESGFARSGRPCTKYPVDIATMPVPLSISLALKLLLQCHDLGRTEKLTWEYPFTYQEVECSIAAEKFGIRLYVEQVEAGRGIEARTIAGKIASAARMMDKNLLSMMGKQALIAGNITIPNLYYKLRGLYEYFRSAAHEAYAGNGELARKAEEDSANTFLVGPINKQLAIRREGLYATIAMVSSYFSLLEHVLVLSIPSTNFDPPTEEVSSFIGMTLFEKYDRIFAEADSKEAHRLRERLKHVAETWRNPYSHGGFDKMRKAIGFHVEGLGVLPIGLSSITKTPEFHLFPDRDQGFDELCKTFDEIDTFLTEGPLWASTEWMKTGLDVPLDKESLEKFRQIEGEGGDNFAAYIAETSYYVDRAMNMDW
ncbi:hypothetical protein AB0C94_12545 [Streptomyces griseus]|uniref:hypothetical protein n=1 Tax=Streptomyces griseus TaxID=1911 RepID=UPI0034072210